MAVDIRIMDGESDGYPVKVTSDGALVVCPEEHHASFTEEYTADASGNVAAVTIITPSSGLKLSVHAFNVLTDGTSGTISLDFLASGKKILRMYPSKTAQANTTLTHVFGAVDEVITFTAAGIGSGSKVFVSVQYINEIV